MFLETPVSNNATLGSTVHFYCKLSSSGSLYWLINGAELWDDTNRHRQLRAYTTENGRVSTLQVTALMVNDNLIIQCVAYPDTRTDPVMLRIQGTLCRSITYF